MFSRNKVMLLTGVVNFLNRNADLSKHELRITHVIRPGTAQQCKPEFVVKFSLVKKSGLFKTEVWTLSWYEGFKDYIELPDNLCNPVVQGILARERAEQEAIHAEQNCQATLFHANSSA